VTQAYPELERLARRRRAGVGSDFSSYIGNADFAAKWNDVEAQLAAEGNGAGSLAVLSAQNAFASTFDNLSSQLGVDPATALEASKQFVIAGHTIAGAVQTVEKIQQAVAGGDVAGAFNILVGAMVAAAVASGAATAGVGALITIGVGLALAGLTKLGLFGEPAQGTEWCSGLRTTGQIAVQVGCVVTQGDYNALSYPTGSPYWRRFPKASGGNTNDDYWYNAKGVTGGLKGFNTVDWSGNPNGPKTYWTSYGNSRLIDNAFPDYHYLACQTVPKGLEAFAQAFTQAWIANKEYALNGLKVQPDWQVLRTLLGIWNRAHNGSSYVDIAHVAKPSVTEPTFADISNPSKPTFDTTWGPICPSNLPALFLTLVDGVIGHATTGDPVFANFYNASTNTLRIHTGPTLVVKKVIALHLGPSASAAKTPLASVIAAFQALPFPAQVAVVAGGAAATTAAGGSIYALATRQSVGAFWSGVWQGTQKTGKDAALAAVGVFDQVGHIFGAGKKRT
jgi:hypothetical protein